FQAEDGIRDLIVTGVQTCALPILQSRPVRPCPSVLAAEKEKPKWSGAEAGMQEGPFQVSCGEPPSRHPHRVFSGLVNAQQDLLRSEERRVGKELRARRGHEQ